MAKRFTDTDKWKRPWFRTLTPEARWFWIYLLDNCDNTGVWIADYGLASYQLGFEVKEKDVLSWFKDKLVPFSGDKFFIPSFVDFQYGELNPNNNAHKPVIKILQKVAPHKDLMSPSLGAQDKDKDKDKDISLKSAEKLSLHDFEAVYAEHYPRKEGKHAGLKECKKQITTHEDFLRWRNAMINFGQHCRQTKKEKEYIPHFSTFMSKKRWLDEIEQPAKQSLMDTL